MPKTVTSYSLLVSCPGDVVDLLPVIDKVVAAFNENLGQLNNVRIDVKHWSRSAYPDTGEEAQALLNKQFIDDCDFCVALLGTRFGTPTEKHNSGTEEEIENMISSGKHVMLYFIERSVDPSEIDLDQYKKVKDYREKFEEEKRGSYWVVKDNIDFERKFSNHLNKLMLDEIDATIGEANRSLIDDFPSLSIERIPCDEHTHFADSSFIENLENKISKSIDDIRNFALPKSKDEEKDIHASLKEKVDYKSEQSAEKSNSETKDEELEGTIKTKSGEILKPTHSTFIDLFQYSPVVIQDTTKSIITKYCDDHSITISDDFWNLSDLHVSTFSLAGSLGGPSYQGSEEAKDKYFNIIDLKSEIDERNAYVAYFQSFDELFVLAFCIKNDGTHFDEDLDITLRIAKDCIIPPEKIPVPGMPICEEINKEEVYNIFLKMPDSPEYDAYTGGISYAAYNYEPLLNDPFNRKTAKEKYEEEKGKYLDNVKTIFDYDLFPASEDEGEDIWKFNVRYLKQHTKMYLPSVLLFKRLPDKIKYEIKSKYSKDVVKGEINIEDGDV